MNIFKRIYDRTRWGSKRWGRMFDTGDIAFTDSERSTLRVWAVSILTFAIVLFIAAFANANDPGSRIGIYTIEVKKTVDLSKLAVRVKAGNQSGCGVNVEQGVLTCFHVIEKQAKISVTMDGETAKATVIGSDEKNDVALLSVKWSNQHQTAKVATNEPAEGSTVMSAGAAKDGTITIESHRFNVKHHGEYQYTNCPQSGRSGSPMFNADFELISLQTGCLVDVVPYTGRGVELKAIQALLKPVAKVAGTESGIHSHRCRKCGTVWRHDHVSFGSTAHHTCPKCGTVNWEVAESSPVAKVAPVIRYQSGNCPSGNCPLQRRLK